LARPRVISTWINRPSMFLLYSLLFSLGVLLSAPYYLWQYRGRTDFRHYLRERLGFLPPSFQCSLDSQGRKVIWVHAVSVGETFAVVRLVREIQQRYPQKKVVISHVTPTGREAGEARMPQVSGRFYLPFDWEWCVRRVLDQLRPSWLLIAETEVWPNLLRAAHAYGTRIALVNARLSAGSFHGYSRLRFFWGQVLSKVDYIFAQTLEDAERFRKLGASPERVFVTGNLKFDNDPPKLGPLPGRLKKVCLAADRTPLVVAASTMPGEELLLLSAWDEIRRRHPGALLIVAPRHPPRFEDVAQLLAQAGKTFVRRTALETGDEELVSQLASPEILLLNTIGELAGVFQVADIVFVGGSFVSTGGHNLIEPAYWSKPILFGPHMENFRDTAERFLAAGAAVQVQNPAELARETLGLLDHATRQHELGERAKQVLERESGATRRVLEHLQELGF